MKAILGKWTMRPENNAPVERELKADGTIIKTGGGTGKWVIDGSSLILRYPDGSHSTFELPVRNGKLTGKGLWGEKITAERK